MTVLHAAEGHSHPELPFSCKVVENMSTVFGPQFFEGWWTLKCFTALCYRGVPPQCEKVWLSSVG